MKMNELKVEALYDIDETVLKSNIDVKPSFLICKIVLEYCVR